MIIKKANELDIKNIVKIYSVCFPGETDHEVWINACIHSFPKSVYYIAVEGDSIQGYILWSIKNGFRANAIVELEQIGVHPDQAGKGVGRKLINESFELFKGHITELGLDIGSIIVTTSEGNYAEELYKSTLGVTRNGMITEYGSGNELILFNRLK